MIHSGVLCIPVSLYSLMIADLFNSAVQMASMIHVGFDLSFDDSLIEVNAVDDKRFLSWLNETFTTWEDDLDW